MQIQVIAHALQKKLQDGDTGTDPEIECAVYKFKISRTALKQAIHFVEKGLQFEWQGGFIQRGKTKLAFKRAAARGFDINQAITNIIIGIKLVGQFKITEGNHLTGNQLVFNRFTGQCGGSHIFIAGDANNDVPLLHEAADEGRIAGANAASWPEIRSQMRRAGLGIVFSDPQIATAGLSWREVQSRRLDVATGEVSFEDQGRSRVMNINKGLMRLWAANGTGLFLGAEMIGPRAEHLAHLLAWSAQQGLSVSEMLDMPYYHPVIEEGLRSGLRDLNRNLHIGPELVPHCLDCGPGA